MCAFGGGGGEGGGTCLTPYNGGLIQKSCMTLGTLYMGNCGTIVYKGCAGFFASTGGKDSGFWGLG